MSEVISDLLKIPSLDDRARVLASSPQIRSLVEGVLENDGDYQSADEVGRGEIRKNLGFPAPAAEADPTEGGGPLPPGGVRLGPTAGGPPVARPSEEATRIAVERLFPGQSRSSLNIFQNPEAAQRILDEATKIDAILAQSPRQQYTVPTAATYYGEKANALEREATQSFMQPMTPENLPGIVAGYYKKNLGAPAIREFYGGSPDKVTSSLARGFLSAVPGVSAITTPKDAPKPAFLSIENAARIATDTIITLPILQKFMGAKTALEAFGFFSQFPGVARAVANASLVGGADTAYRAFVDSTTNLIRDGKLDLADVSGRIAPNWLNATAMILGFHGIVSGVASQFPGRAVREGVEQGVSAFGRELGGAQPTGSAPKPSGGNAIDFAIAPQAGTNPFEFTGNAPPKGPFTGVAEGLRPFMVDPRVAMAFEDISARTKIKINADGSLDTTITQPVLKSMFVKPERAVSGDIAYWNTEGGQPRVGRVLDTFEDGITAHDGRREQFIKFSDVATAKKPYALGEEVFTAMGEPLTVQGYAGNGRVFVQGADGKMRLEAVDQVRSYELRMTTQNNAERAAAGIDTPAPTGTSVFEIFTNERGAVSPVDALGGLWQRRNSKKPASPTSLPISVALQPGGKDFGAYRYYFDPIFTLSMLGKPQYDLGSGMLIQAKQVSSMLESQSRDMLLGFRKMLGDAQGARVFKDAAGGNKLIAEKLSRFAVGVPRPGETLTNVERSVMDSWGHWVAGELIPAINAKRALVGQQPVPPDYPWALQLFPELVLNRGYRGGGLAEAVGRSITPTGVDDLVQVSGAGARLHVNANFWELAQQAMRWVNHEKAFRDPITFIKNLANVEQSSTNKGYLAWLGEHLDGKTVSPDVADITGFSRRVDQALVSKGGKYENAVLEMQQPLNLTYKNPVTKKPETATLTGSRTFESPMASLAEQNLGEWAMTTKQLNYGNTIGLNARTVLLNLTQPWTHTLPNLPGNPIANAYEILSGQLKSLPAAVMPLFSQKAIAHYQSIGVLHDLDEIFTAPGVTRLTGGAPLGTLYAGSWFLNHYRALLFYGMRMSEVSNRIAAYEGMKGAMSREARARGFQTFMDNDPAFVQAVERSAVSMANISNFLYGKGFKSPLQVDLGVGLDAASQKMGGIRGIRTVFAPLGELMFQYNTFGVKTAGLIATMAKQTQSMGAQQPLATRLAEFGSPQEFGQFLKSMDNTNRYAFLRYMMGGLGLATMVSSGLGIASLFWQMQPLAPYSFEPFTAPVLTLGHMAKDILSLNVGGAARTAIRTLTPAPFAGSAKQRWDRGGNLKDSLFSTKSDIEGTKGPWATPSPQEQLDMLLGNQPPSFGVSSRGK